MAFRKRAAILSCLLITAGLFVLGLGIYLVKGGKEQFQPKVRYTVLFANSGGLGGGDYVYLDGQKVGRVVYTVRAEAKREVEVIVEVGKTVGIPVGSLAIVTKSITGDVGIEIISSRSTEVLAAGAAIRGRLPRSFDQIETEVAALGEDIAGIKRKFGSLVTKAKAVVTDFDPGTMGSNWNEAVATLGRAQDKWELLLEEVRGPAGELGGEFERGLADWRELGRELRDDGPPLRDRLEVARANFDEASGEIRDVLADLEGMKAGFGEAMDRFESAAGKFRGVAHAVEETIVEVKPAVKRLVKEAKEAFGRFQTLESDLRRAPWKLLNKPSPEEVTAIHRFNTVRLYVEAANEVSRTVEGLDVLRRLDVLGDPGQADQVEELLLRLRRALAEFDAQQRRVVALVLDEKAARPK